MIYILFYGYNIRDVHANDLSEDTPEGLQGRPLKSESWNRGTTENDPKSLHTEPRKITQILKHGTTENDPKS